MKAKFVSESISFERGGDPLGRMGIGGFSFDTLRPGTILKSKKFFGVTKSGKIAGYHSASISISPDNYLIVRKVIPGDKPNTKIIYWYKSRDLGRVMEISKKMENGEAPGISSWHFTSGHFTDLSKIRFNYRLDIIRPDIETNESVKFERGLDPKRSMGIGHITWENLAPGDILMPKKDFKINKNGEFIPPSRSGGLYFYGESPLVVIKKESRAVMSSSGPGATVKNGYRIHYYSCWEMNDARETAKEIRTRDWVPDVLRRPINATEAALAKRLDIVQGF